MLGKYFIPYPFKPITSHILIQVRKCLCVCYETKKIQDVLGRSNHALSFNTTRTAEKTTLPILILLHVYSLPSRYLATIREYTF
jgi:hypothetical protein